MTGSTENPSPEFPTDWHTLDVIKGIEARQIAEEKYEVRSNTHIVELDKKGFDLFRDGSAAGEAIYRDYFFRNQMKAVPRTDKQW